MRIPQATKTGYVDVCDFGCFDASYPNSSTRRGRVQGGGNITPALTASGTEYIWLIENYMDNKENYIGLQKAQEMFSKKAENAWYDGTEAYDAFVFSLYAEPIWWDDKINLIKGYRKRHKRPEGKGWCFDFVNQRWFRIRKLTPVECFRLMDVNEEGIDKLMASGISKTQLYKCAGNSIVVSCLYHIFKNLFCPEQINDESVQVGEQLSLF